MKLTYINSKKQVLFWVTCALLLNSGVSNAQIVTMPFDYQGSHLSIKVSAGNNENLHFIFDSGCTGATIDSAKAEAAGIGKENRQLVSVSGSGGSQSYWMAMAQSIKLDSVKLKNINLVLANFSSLSQDTGNPIDGIIGYEVLARYVTRLDFDRKELSLFDGIQHVDTTGYTGIPFEFSKNILIPRFPITVALANGESFTGKVMFDTGNAFSLIVSTPFNKFHNFVSKIGESFTTGGRGMNASTTDQVAVIKSMSFNGFDFGKMSVRLTVNDKAEPRDGYLGILGMEVIKRFNIILDYAGKKIYLKPNGAYNNALKIEVQELPKQVDNAADAAFLNLNRTKPGVQVTPSGLQYKVIKKGTGALPTDADRVTLHYSLSLTNGKAVWKPFDEVHPWVHHLDKAIAGIREAALMMPVGSKYTLYIPAALAFGAEGYQEVPACAAVICELEVVKAVKE
ncbi:MAG: aspartyl protease family protein [Bacteroidota bacterium]